jgi:hypothetical protein
MKLADRKADRGFVAEGDEIIYAESSNDELIDLLKSRIAIERTIGARLLGSRGDVSIEYLLIAIKTEEKLYPRLEICRSLAQIGEPSIDGLIQLLGVIGNNQHQTPSDEPFLKESYPLPRDLAARTLISIGQPALPVLCGVLNEDHPAKISEAIDAIGFICSKGGADQYLKTLMTCYNRFKNNDLLRWKLIRAMSSFPESLIFLEKHLSVENNPAIQQEIKRSIRIINKIRR